MTTPNIVPRGNGEGGIGTNEKFWKNGYFENLQTRGGTVATESYVQQKTEEHNSAASVHTANLASKAEAEAGTNTSKFMTPARDREAIQAFVGGDLTGMIFAFAGNSIPSGFLLCDGSKVSRTTYKKLFNVIGTTYGAGDGSTTFTLPNLIDRFLEGSSAAGKYREAGLPNITGSLSIRGWNDGIMIHDVAGAFSITEKFGDDANTAQGSQILRKEDRISFNAANSNSAYGKATTVQPAALSCKLCIKY
jgi:microcystin-dependent protein